jgi:hypothetical protein
MRRIAALCFVLAACESDPGFVASESAFRHFDTWTRFDRGSAPVGFDHPDGETFVYIDRLPPSGATVFPDGTLIVRVTTGGAPELWEVHAMARRGGEYNASGARGWEFFDLRLETAADGTLVPRILWRGNGPGEGDGYQAPDGGVLLDCNHCHGAYVENDSILGPELDLRTF